MKRRIISDDFIRRLESIVLNMKGAMKGFFGGNHKTTSYGSTVEFADFREYVLGDDLRRIDWNLYSRFEKHYIKLFVDERQMHIQFFLDCSSSMDFEGSNKKETALKIAAALGYLSVHNMDRVSYKIIKNKNSASLGGVVSGKESYYRMLDVLETVTCSGDADIEKAITNDLNPGYNDGLTVIISDFLTESNYKAAIDYLLYRRREVLVIQVLSPDEVNPSYNGRTVLMDTESTDITDEKNLKINITRSEYEAYKDALKDYLDDFKKFCNSRNVGYVMVTTDDNFENILLEQLYNTGVVK